MASENAEAPSALGTTAVVVKKGNELLAFKRRVAQLNRKKAAQLSKVESERDALRGEAAKKDAAIGNLRVMMRQGIEDSRTRIDQHERRARELEVQLKTVLLAKAADDAVATSGALRGEPHRVLARVAVREAAGVDQSWCCVQWKGSLGEDVGAAASSSSSSSSDGPSAGRSVTWVRERSLLRHVRETFAFDLLLPGSWLGPREVEGIRAAEEASQREQQQLVADFRRYQVDSEISLREAHSEVKELRTELNQLHAQELVATPAVDGSTAEMEATPIAGARGGGGGGHRRARRRRGDGGGGGGSGGGGGHRKNRGGDAKARVLEAKLTRALAENAELRSRLTDADPSMLAAAAAEGRRGMYAAAAANVGGASRPATAAGRSFLSSLTAAQQVQYIREKGTLESEVLAAQARALEWQGRCEQLVHKQRGDSVRATLEGVSDTDRVETLRAGKDDERTDASDVPQKLDIHFLPSIRLFSPPPLEHTHYKAKALALLEEREREISRLKGKLRAGGGGGGNGGDSIPAADAAAAAAAKRRAEFAARGAEPDKLLALQTQHEYLKSVVTQYLASPAIATEADSRKRMETAIATVLQLSPTELREIQKKRDDAATVAASWW